MSRYKGESLISVHCSCTKIAKPERTKILKLIESKPAARSLHSSRDGTPTADCLQEFSRKERRALEELRFWAYV